MLTSTSTVPNPFELAQAVDCGRPDRVGSPGYCFLDLVAESFADALSFSDDGVVSFDDMHTIVDSCVPVYTHELWCAFVELEGYNFDVRDYFVGFDYRSSNPAEDFNRLPQTVLYVVGLRVCEYLGLWRC